MPSDIYVVRFATDDEGRDVQHEAFITTEQLPWPPHRYAAMGVATTPEGINHMIGIAIHPNSEATLEDYNEVLAGMRPTMTLTAEAKGLDLEALGLLWFIRTKTSQMDEETADSPNLMRGCLYRPCTDEELVEWVGPEKVDLKKEIDIVQFGGGTDA